MSECKCTTKLNLTKLFVRCRLMMSSCPMGGVKGGGPCPPNDSFNLLIWTCGRYDRKHEFKHR